MTLDNRNDWRTDELADLCDAVLTLEHADEVARFLRDLCTHREIEELAGRWAIVHLLARGLPYREIAQQRGTSTATVTRVNQWLQHGTGGYQTALARLGRGPAR